MNLKKLNKIGVIGLGYVGLPLALEFSKKYQVHAYDKSKKRIKELQNNNDITMEVSKKQLSKSKNIFFTKNINELKECNVFILALPTPINLNKKPDLSYLKNATKETAKIIKVNDIVIYESTVYPGVTEDICVPILEKYSKLIYNVDFFCGYSPERINPGDKKRTLTKIKKITSGSNKKVAELIDALYASIITAGTHLAPSIKVAESAKVIENIQRDLNIALINELSILFDKLQINTSEVLDAASTKWNFLDFKPGLVGGHCIGVDPYYLTHLAKNIGFDPKVILSGRNVNDSMSKHIIKKINRKLKTINKTLSNKKVLIMGLTFKENCPDTRNSKVNDIINLLNKKNCSIDTYDPWVKTYKNLISRIPSNKYDIIIIAVAHDEFIKVGEKKIMAFGKKNSIIFDVKNIFNNHKFLTL